MHTDVKLSLPELLWLANERCGWYLRHQSNWLWQIWKIHHGNHLNREIREERSGIPGFPKPVAHNSNHTGPTSGLQQAVHNPQAAVQPFVVETQPFCERAKDKHLEEEETKGICNSHTETFRGCHSTHLLQSRDHMKDTLTQPVPVSHVAGITGVLLRATMRRQPPNHCPPQRRWCQRREVIKLSALQLTSSKTKKWIPRLTSISISSPSDCACGGNSNLQRVAVRMEWAQGGHLPRNSARRRSRQRHGVSTSHCYGCSSWVNQRKRNLSNLWSAESFSSFHQGAAFFQAFCSSGHFIYSQTLFWEYSAWLKNSMYNTVWFQL